MPADTAEKRYSAMHMTCPWRGLTLVPSAIDQGERQAVMFMYSGILAAGGATDHHSSIGRSGYKHRFRDSLRNYLPEG